MKRILVIDDDSQVLRMLREMLSGYDVIAADTGSTGLEILDQGPKVALVICDMLMPVMGGLETIRGILDRDRTTKIIALSGGGPFGRFDLLKEALEAGADASLQKPVDWEELTTIVARLLEENHAEGDDQEGNRATG
ncbi:response regulator [bacterium]|nr:response regulator [bacterium]